ncbi:MAG: VOC family protein [Sphingomonas sp.]|uniref:VOC family protein n=1 Tax=Sphingomonas sp. TaxID=28214 RepID=UPI00182FD2E9|nr:VOC family protein [Sphingomonas sp.]MBA3667139.1 VOC family protein [Sphingomonas sp.]
MTRNQHGDYIWYELLTRDPKAAKRFYDPVAGWTIEAEASNPMDYRMIDTGDGMVGGTMTLTKDMIDQGARPTWLGYIGVDDVDDTVAKIEAKGGKALMPANDIPDVGRIALVADPQGNPFYVMRGSVADHVSTSFAPDKKGHAAWNELVTSDLDAAKSFYPDVFGWTLGDVMPMGEAGDYQFVHHSGQRIGAMMKASSGASTGWGFAFNNDDIDGAVDRIRTGGGTVRNGPMEVPDGQRVVQASDPEGVPFMLVGK